MKTNHHELLDTLKSGIKKKILSWLTLTTFMLQVLTPAYAVALTNGEIQDTLEAMADIEFVSTSSEQYQAPDYINTSGYNSYPTIKTFFDRIFDTNKALLPTPSPVPIIMGDITLMIPVNLMGSAVGDTYVQSRYVRDQIHEKLGRNIINAGQYGAASNIELAQLTRLYDNAYLFLSSTNSNIGFGDTIPETQFTRETSPYDMVWPEYRTINGKTVLVPVVYFSANTINNETVSEHTVTFGSNVNLAGFQIDNVDVTFRSDFINIAGAFSANNSNIDFESEHTQLIIDGQLDLLSSIVTADNTLAISAHSIQAGTIVQHIDLGNSSHSVYGQITSITAGGSIALKSTSNVVIQGVVVNAGDQIYISAEGDIYIGGIALTESFTGRENGYSVQRSSIDYLQSSLTAEDNIQLIANGSITLDAAEIVSSNGHIEILAGLGITVIDSQSQFQETAHGKFGKKKIDKSIYQTVAIRSILDAGKGVKLHSEYGDINLRSVDITSTEGTQVTAKNGGLNMLMSTETDHYSYSSVKKGLFTTKTKSYGHENVTGVPNSIVGGFAVEALNGITVEFTGDPELNIAEQVDALSEFENLSWMADLRAQSDTEFTAIMNLEDSWYESNTSLSPAAIAVLTIAVAVAAGPAATSLSSTVGSATAAVGSTFSAALGAASAAAFTSLVTTATISLANGNSLEDTLKSLSDEDNLRNLAVAMVTAGAVAAANDAFFTMDTDAVNVAVDNGSTQAAVDSALSATEQSLQSQLIQTTTDSLIRASVSTVFNKGDWQDLGDAFASSLAQKGVAYLGENLAQRIGEWHKEVDISGEINTSDVLRYVAHAATGCLTGSLTAEINDSSPQEACTYGAGGAVVGEVTADIYAESQGYYELNDEGEELDALLTDTLGEDYQYLTEEQLSNLTLEEFGYLSDLKNIQSTLDSLKASGVDFARLSAAMGSFLAGADALQVNIAADAGQNAAEHNAFFVIPLIKAGLFIWTAVEAYEAGQAILSDIERYNNGEMSPEEQAELLEQIATDSGLAILGFLGASKLEKVIDFLKSSKAGSLIESKVNYVIYTFEKQRLQKIWKDNRTDITHKGGDDVNSELFPSQTAAGTAPFDSDYPAAEFTSIESDEFVRFYNDTEPNGSPVGAWMMRRTEVTNPDGTLLTAAEIKDKFAIPGKAPNKMVTMNAPAGSRMIVGKAAKIEVYGNGGGEQYYSKDWVTEDWFDETKIIDVD